MAGGSALPESSLSRITTHDMRAIADAQSSVEVIVDRDPAAEIRVARQGVFSIWRTRFSTLTVLSRFTTPLVLD